jgi:tyrosine-specific transport protein
VKKKQLNAIFLLAGTAIGSGMISLPIVLSHIGMIPTLFLILFCATTTYFSALVRTELNLRSDSRFTLEDVGKRFSGPTAALIGNACLKILSFALLAAYVYGLGSTICPDSVVAKILVGVCSFALFAFSSERLVSFNRKLFVVLLATVLALILCMLIGLDFHSLPKTASAPQFSRMCVILPTLFTSFGFQGSLHSLTKLCDNDRKMIKTACFWGSLIPAIVYLAWTFCVMAAVFNSQPALFAKMVAEGVDVGELIAALGNASGVAIVKSATVSISVLAIATSIAGVGIGFVDDIEMAFDRLNVAVDAKIKRPVSALIATVPAIFIATVVPEAFIKTLSFAGMILAVIALFLPSFLFFKLKKTERRVSDFVVYGLVIFGLAIVGCAMASLIST